jgi:hypothetical protein
VRKVRSGIAVIGALLPIIYCGGLLYYFIDVGGSIEGAQQIGLGPTVLGLGVVGLLFCIPVILKIIRVVARLSSHGPGGPGSPTATTHGAETGFDAAAAVARYMASRPAQPASPPATAPLAAPGPGAAKRSGFGRKND